VLNEPRSHRESAHRTSGRVGMKRITPLPRRVSPSPAPNRTCEFSLSAEEIAARFFVTPAVVKQRLRLASVSPKLLDVYAEDGMTLEQLMAFAVSADHARQEQVWETVQRSWNKESYFIRRELTESTVRASDKPAQFVGLDAYEAAGGAIMATRQRNW
jgi:ParB-like chromosome segregation protein Spo0J